MSRKGRKAFRQCDVKVVEFKDFVYTDDERQETTLAEIPSEDSRILSGSSAVLHCPRTEDDKVNVESRYSNHPTRPEALDSVEELAGKLLCEDCMFSTMTPVEVSIARKDLAAAETERIKAYQALEEARQEIEQVSPH